MVRNIDPFPRLLCFLFNCFFDAFQYTNKDSLYIVFQVDRSSVLRVTKTSELSLFFNHNFSLSLVAHWVQRLSFYPCEVSALMSFLFYSCRFTGSITKIVVLFCTFFLPFKKYTEKCDIFSKFSF